MKVIYFFAVLVLLLTTSFSQNNPWNLSGNLQIRTEVDGRDFNNKTYAPMFTSLRTRFAVENNSIDNIQFYLQLQDSRVLGEELSTSSNLKNVDIYQAFIKVKNVFNSGINLQAGKFMMSYGTERFFGANNWSYIGRSFSGLRLNYEKDFKLDLFAITVARSAGVLSPSPSNYKLELPEDSSYVTYGFWFSNPFSKTNILDIFSYYELNRKKSDKQHNDLQILTTGLSYQTVFDKLKVLLEGAYQTGKKGMNADVDVSAYVASLSFNYSLPDIKVGLAGDMYSGTESGSSKYNTYTNSFSTNHKLLGFMDYFTNVSSSTKNLGINDIYLTLDFDLVKNLLNANIMGHYFMTNQKSSSGLNALGSEIDVTLKYKAGANVVFTWGGSLFLPGDLMKEWYKVGSMDRKDTSFWSYLMISGTF